MKPEPRKRGRPRTNPHQLAVWKPPADWSRLVVWVSPDERKALKRVAAEADTSVADLVRGLASGLAKSVITADELIEQFRKGASVMEKIPTVFERDDHFGVKPQVRAGCEWVVAGEGAATEKLDGMNIRLTIRSGTLVRIEKRRNPTRAQKEKGIKDGWYVDTDERGPEDKWILEAARTTDVSEWPDGEHSCEALGPSIQGNTLGLERHVCVPFNMEVPQFQLAHRTFDYFRESFRTLESKYAPGHLAEGIVFHHPDGRRAKLKRKDFRGVGDPGESDRGH